MSESEASVHAIAVAQANDVDLDDVVGTGHGGNITKADVEAFIERRKELDSSPLTNEEGEYLGTDVADVNLIMVPPETASSEVVMPDSTNVDLLDMVQTIAALKAEIEGLKTAQADTTRRIESTYDLTDDLFFIAKPNGRRWEERRIINRKQILVDMVATAFYGPFNTAEDIDEYLAAKARKRQDAAWDWQDVQTMTGREARQLRQEEDHNREAQWAQDEVASVPNVLEQRIFQQNMAAQPQVRAPEFKQPNEPIPKITPQTAAAE
jgi:hypothetical protein